jgi:predicted dehydrogenase
MDLLSSGMIADADGARPALVRQPFFAGLDRLLVMEVLIHHIDTLRYLLGPLTLAASAIGRSTPRPARPTTSRRCAWSRPSMRPPGPSPR